MKNLRDALLLVTLSAVAWSRPAAAHFKLLKPTSWLKEDAMGAPQKGGPCGPGGYDDVEPIPTSGAVTQFHAGDTIEVDWVDTVAHPGYFRIALAENRADLKNPTIVQDSLCNFDESMVPTMASGNVLADGVHFRTRNGFNAPAGTMFSSMVTLPNQPCDKCTLQVIQIMENDLQSLSDCYYFHCADISILPAGQGANTGGTTGSGAGGTSAGTGGLVGVGGLPVGAGGMDVSMSAGGALGLGGTVGTWPGAGGVVATGGTTGSLIPGAGGYVAPPPTTTGGGGTLTAPGGTSTPATGGATAPEGSGGEQVAAQSSGPSSSSCATAIRSHARGSTLASVALLAFFGFARRRSLRPGRRK